MTAPAWFSPLSIHLVANLPEEVREAAETQLAGLSTRLAAAGPAEQLRVVRSFSSRSMGSALDLVDLPDLPFADALQSSVAGVRTLLDGALAPLNELRAQADQLRQAAAAAWRVSQEASTTVRTLERAEKIAAAAALITGLPPVTAAWALASNAKLIALEVAEVAGRGARAADAAWGSVQHIIDMVHRQAFAPIDSVTRMARQAAGAMALGQQSLEQAYPTVLSNFSDAVDAILPLEDI
jgi:hypothetical protein